MYFVMNSPLSFASAKSQPGPENTNINGECLLYNRQPSTVWHLQENKNIVGVIKMNGEDGFDLLFARHGIRLISCAHLSEHPSPTPLHKNKNKKYAR